MVDYVCSVAIQANSFQNNMADKAVWRINENTLYRFILREVRWPISNTDN